MNGTNLNNIIESVEIDELIKELNQLDQMHH